MRILHVGKYYPPAKGGMERYLADLVEAQRAAGDEVAVLVHAGPGAAPPDDPPWLMRCPVWTRLIFAPIAPLFPFWLARAIRRHAPDVLHIHMPNVSPFWALIVPAARRVPWVVQWHSDVEPSRFKLKLRFAYPYYRIFERALLERAECIVVASPQYLESSRPLAPWRHTCHVVPLGVAPARLPDVNAAAESSRWDPKGLRVLAVGRLTYYKGFETLVRAVAAESTLQLRLAGDGEERPALERVVAQAAAGDRIGLLGEVDDDVLCRLLASCDVLALPSRERTEAFGLVLVEAMRYGKPLAASSLADSGVTFLARAGENAVLAPAEDVGAWRGALTDLARDPEKRRLLGQRGRERYLREFDIARVARRLRELYTAVLSVAADGGESERFEDSPGEEPSAPAAPGGLLVVIPALDEADCIGEVIMRARALGATDIVVVDDGSKDDTPAVALSQGAIVLRAPLWQGAWGAIQTGIRYALRHGYGAVVTMDGDGQHEPEYLKALVEAGRDADVVIAACPSRGSRLRHVAWRYFRFLTGFAFEDLTSGFRYYNRRALLVLASKDATLLDYQDIGVLLLLRHARLRIVEIPVAMNTRRSGASRVFFSWATVARYMIDTSLLCLARWKPGR